MNTCNGSQVLAKLPGRCSPGGVRTNVDHLRATRINLGLSANNSPYALAAATRRVTSAGRMGTGLVGQNPPDSMCYRTSQDSASNKTGSGQAAAVMTAHTTGRATASGSTGTDSEEVSLQAPLEVPMCLRSNSKPRHIH